MKKKGKLPARTLDSTYTVVSTIVDVRRVILKRLKEIHKTRYWLAQRTKMRTATLYTYLTGKGETSSEYVERMLSVLGMEIRTKE